MNIDSRIDNVAHRHSLSNLLASLLLMALLTGCANLPWVVVKDPTVLQSSVHVAYSLDKKGKYPPSVTQSGNAIEFSHVYMNGGSNQNLTSGQLPIEFGNTEFIAPQQLTNDFNSNYTAISYRWRKFFGDRSLGMELAGGVGRSSVSLRVKSPTQQDSVNLLSYGIQSGVAFIWRLRPGTSLHFRTSGFATLLLFESREQYMDQYEIYVAQALSERVALRIGYASCSITGATSIYKSDFQIISRGPTVNLEMNF